MFCTINNVKFELRYAEANRWDIVDIETGVVAFSFPNRIIPDQYQIDLAIRRYIPRRILPKVIVGHRTATIGKIQPTISSESLIIERFEIK